MKRFLKIAAFVVLAIALLLLGEWYARRGKLPPPSVKDLNGYLAWRPEANQFVRLPNERLLALGSGAGLVPSGPSAHIFDSNGDLLDSTADMGDDPQFNARWNISYPLQIEGRALVDR